jgi:predicted RNase H-like HicB family nuclease
MTAQTYTAIVQRENGGYAAQCPEAGTTGKGATIEDAIASLRAATNRILQGVQLAEVNAPLVTTFAVGGIAPSSDSATAAPEDDEFQAEENIQPIPMTGEALLASPLWGFWKDRTDIGDTLEFANELRRRAEHRERD